MTFFDSYTLHGGANITIQDENVINSREMLTTYAGYRLNASNGLVYKMNPNGTWVSLGYYWVDPTGEAPNYEVRATLNSGDNPTGTEGSWLALTSTRDWYLVQSSAGATMCNLTIEIRDAATQTVRDTATVYLEAEYA